MSLRDSVPRRRVIGIAFRRKVTMRKAMGVVVLVALIMAVIGIWAKVIPIATKPVIATTIEASNARISPFELMLKSGNDLPIADYGDPI
jgi:hypothetical protein